jgi:hypothetical protein
MKSVHGPAGPVTVKKDILGSVTVKKSVHGPAGPVTVKKGVRGSVAGKVSEMGSLALGWIAGGPRKHYVLTSPSQRRRRLFLKILALALFYAAVFAALVVRQFYV